MPWLERYKIGLMAGFEIIMYDSRIIGEVDTLDGVQENIHRQFVEGGIDRAVEYLLENEKGKTDVLAFSVGGLIAWKAAMKGLNIERLCAVSSTRLRYETEKPQCKIKLFYGVDDPYRPQRDWFEKMQLDYQIIPNEGHDIYTNPENFALFCKT